MVLSDVDRMMQLVLIGTKDMKRTDFFLEAARQCQVSVTLLDWESAARKWQSLKLQGAVVKIDPPSYQTVEFQEMKDNVKVYQKQLKALSQITKAKTSHNFLEAQALPEKPTLFLNSPDAILKVLDKRECKMCLMKKGVAVTQMFLERIHNKEELLSLMKQKRVFSVFIKPVCFSGAAGVVAFRYHPKTEKMTAYTSCRIENGVLVNTKVLFYMDNEEKINRILEAVLSLDVIVERWYPKAKFQGKSYDLRVVYQFGHIAYMVVRQAAGPITNLHLNNQALAFEQLGLNQKDIEAIEKLCRQAVEAIPGLTMAGIDILLEKNTKKPYIIEMNGQGDLIYQDIYGKNRIYQEQVQQMALWQKPDNN